MSGAATLVFAPLLPWPLILGLAAVAAALVGVALFRRARGVGWRTAVFAVALAALANPSLLEEERESLPDVAVVVVDESPSQAIGDRAAAAKAAEAALTQALGRLQDLEVRLVRAGRGDEQATEAADGTRLFEPLQRALTDVPRERIAGAVLITDGQVHDVPAAEAARRIGAPVHALLTAAMTARASASRSPSAATSRCRSGSSTAARPSWSWRSSPARRSSPCRTTARRWW